MDIVISHQGVLSLRNEDDFHGFAIVDESESVHRDAINEIGTSDGEDHYWIGADAVIALSTCKGDAPWESSFWEMLEKAAPYGYADITRRLVKAHIKKAD